MEHQEWKWATTAINKLWASDHPQLETKNYNMAKRQIGHMQKKLVSHVNTTVNPKVPVIVAYMNLLDILLEKTTQRHNEGRQGSLAGIGRIRFSGVDSTTTIQVLIWYLDSEGTEVDYEQHFCDHITVAQLFKELKDKQFSDRFFLEPIV